MLKDNNTLQSPAHPESPKPNKAWLQAREAVNISPRKYPAFMIKVARKLVFQFLQTIEDCQIIVSEDGKTQVFGDADQADPIRIMVHNPQFYAYLLVRGSMGVGEAYVLNYWQSNQTVKLFRTLLKQQKKLVELEKGLTRMLKPFLKIQHLFNRNTLRGSKKNISAHYDLSNAFYALWLDESMTYSSGIFPSPDASLEAAQFEKLDRICRKLELSPGDHVLEIGTGWGSFAVHAARYYGCLVTTTTISQQQYLLAEQRIREEGLSQKITLLKQDYRILKGRFDKLVSIEMIEAVGHQNIPAFIRSCDALLKPDGLMAIQAITMADQYYSDYLNDVDFIQKYIFPGGNLLSQTHLLQTLKSTDFRLVHLEDIALHYADTLKHWRERFYAQSKKVLKLGFSEHFARLWEYYLLYCEAGFREQHIGTIQVVLAKSKNTAVDLSKQGFPPEKIQLMSVN